MKYMFLESLLQVYLNAACIEIPSYASLMQDKFHT